MKRKFSSSTIQWQQKTVCNVVNLNNSFLKESLFWWNVPLKQTQTCLSQEAFSFNLVCCFFPVKSSLVQDQQSMKIVINHQKPEIKTGSQSQPDLPSRPALLTVFIAASFFFCCFPIQSAFYTLRHRVAGKTASDASRCGVRSPQSRHVRRLWSF